jgi:hypothetical protein
LEKNDIEFDHVFKLNPSQSLQKLGNQGTTRVISPVEYQLKQTINKKKKSFRSAIKGKTMPRSISTDKLNPLQGI